MPDLIHIAEIYPAQLLLLRKIKDHHYTWFLEDDIGKELETEVSAPNIEEAIRLGKKYWKESGFKLVPSGFRFSLPERDEHGTNALFCQAAKSLNSMTGIYFDEELGHNCIVNQIPNRVRDLYNKMKLEQRL